MTAGWLRAVLFLAVRLPQRTCCMVVVIAYAHENNITKTK
jgi:hypothetical protein